MADTLALALPLCGVILVLIGVIVYMAREQDKERARLLDRIQAPQAVQIAAMERAVADAPPLEPPPDVFTERVQPQHDLALATLLGEDTP